MEVGWQDEGGALQPVHHSYSLWLSGICDVGELVWEVAVQVKIVFVVAAFGAIYITCEETSASDEWPACVRISNQSMFLLEDVHKAWLHLLYTSCYISEAAIGWNIFRYM